MKRIARISFFLPFLCSSIPGAYAQSGIISTYAGHPLPVDGTLATTQAIVSPRAVASDGVGGFYVASPLKDQVYHVTAGGIISITAGYGILGFGGDGGPATFALLQPSGLVVDGTGNLFIADGINNRVRKVDTNGIITTIAGNGGSTFAGDGGQANAASLSNPQGIAVDSSGNLFIADSGHNRVRKVSASGVISTVAGSGSSTFSGDAGQATLAGVNPRGVAVDGAGNLFILDFNSRIRKVALDGIITTVAGTGTNGYNGDGIAATLAQINNPAGVAADAAGNFYIADLGNRRVRKVALDGTISTVAGNGTLGFSGDGGLATLASLKGPDGVAVDGAGNLIIADGDGLSLADGSNNRVREVTAGGVINTIAGDGSTGSPGDGGSAGLASLANPLGVTVDGSGNLLIADQNNLRIRKVTPGGLMSTVAGSGGRGYDGDGVLATSAGLDFPTAAVMDAAGNLFIADSADNRIRKVTPDGVISTVAGNGSMGFSGDGGSAIFAKLNFPDGVAVDVAGNLFIADSGNNRIRKVTPGGVINSVTSSGAINSPAGIAFDGNGNLFIAEAGGNRIRKLTPGGALSTVAGIFTSGFSGDGGMATSAMLSVPTAVALDADGNLFIADKGNNRIRKVTLAGVISTVAGNGSMGFSGDGGVATSAALAAPDGVAVDLVGNLYISDMANSRMRKVGLEPDAVLSTSTILRADFDGDGKSDILWQNADGSASIWLMHGLTVTSGGGLIGPGTGWRVVEVADFNGDGKSDVVWQHTDGSVAIWLMDALSVIGGGGLIGPGSGWNVKQIGDFDGDGKSDVLWQHTDGSAAIWLMDGLSVTSGGSLLGPGTGWTVARIGDFNGDGKSDILWQHIDGSSSIWLMNGLGAISGGSLLGPATGWAVQRIGDFNGDGRSDIVWQHADGSVAIWLMNGLTVTSGGSLLGPGTGWSVRNSGDFNGDGKSDIVWQHTDGSAAVWLMDSLNTIGAGGLIGPATGWNVRNSGDFNGDGKSDVVWQNVNGSAAIWLMNGLSSIGGGGLIGAGTGWRPAP